MSDSTEILTFNMGTIHLNLLDFIEEKGDASWVANNDQDNGGRYTHELSLDISGVTPSTDDVFSNLYKFNNTATAETATAGVNNFTQSVIDDSTDGSIPNFISSLNIIITDITNSAIYDKLADINPIETKYATLLKTELDKKTLEVVDYILTYKNALNTDINNDGTTNVDDLGNLNNEIRFIFTVKFTDSATMDGNGSQISSLTVDVQTMQLRLTLV